MPRESIDSRFSSTAVCMRAYDRLWRIYYEDSHVKVRCAMTCIMYDTLPLEFFRALRFFSVRRIAVVRRVIRIGQVEIASVVSSAVRSNSMPLTYLCTRATHPIVLIWIFLRKSLLLQHAISTLDRERRCRWQSTKTIIDKNNYALVIYLRETSTLHFHLFLVILCFH